LVDKDRLYNNYVRIQVHLWEQNDQGLLWLALMAKIVLLYQIERAFLTW
jgi:hypothetical protein